MDTEKVSSLRGAHYNPRKISEPELRALRQSLEVFGDLGGIIFNRRSGNLVGGHQRVKTLDPSWPIKIERAFDPADKCGTVARGVIETPFGELAYRLVDWDEKVERAANLAANRHGGEWDQEKLKEVLVGLDDGSPMIDLTGFSSVELQGLLDRGAAAAGDLPKDGPAFDQITFTVTTDQLAEIGFALDKATKAGGFEGTGNANARGNALHRIAKAYGGE